MQARLQAWQRQLHYRKGWTTVWAIRKPVAQTLAKYVMEGKRFVERVFEDPLGTQPVETERCRGTPKGCGTMCADSKASVV